MKTAELEEMVKQGTDAATVKRVFGEPITQDGVTIIPVAKVDGMAGGGAGKGAEDDGKGWGGGYGVRARALGTYVIKDGRVRFVPAVDVNRAMLMIGMFALGVMLILRGRKRG